MKRTSQDLGEHVLVFQKGLTTREVATIFAREIAAAGGKVTDTFDDGRRLFMRAILPAEREVQKRDRLQGGVAIRATPEKIDIHPYVFRQVCQNGAIIAHAIESRHFELADSQFDPEAELGDVLEEAVKVCSSPQAFQAAAAAIHLSVQSPVDFALTLLPMLTDVPAALAVEPLTSISDRYSKSRDKSRFGLMNVVTAVARDTSDPEVRWCLEKIGGAISAEARVPAKRRWLQRNRLVDCSMLPVAGKARLELDYLKFKCGAGGTGCPVPRVTTSLSRSSIRSRKTASDKPSARRRASAGSCGRPSASQASSAASRPAPMGSAYVRPTAPSTVSATPPLASAITGAPQARASIGTIPKSSSPGNNKARQER